MPSFLRKIPFTDELLPAVQGFFCGNEAWERPLAEWIKDIQKGRDSSIRETALLGVLNFGRPCRDAAPAIRPSATPATDAPQFDCRIYFRTRHGPPLFGIGRVLAGIIPRRLAGGDYVKGNRAAFSTGCLHCLKFN